MKILKQESDDLPVGEKPHAGLILRLLRREGAMFQADIARRLNLSGATLSRAVKKLTEQGLLTAKDVGQSKVKRIPIGLNGKRGYVVGVEYTSKIIRLATLDFAEKIIHTKTKTIDIRKAKDLLEMLVSVVEDNISANRLARDKLLAVTAVDCGIVDIEHGRAVTSSVFPAWHEIDIRDYLQGKLNVPVGLMSTSPARLMAVDRIELRGKYGDMVLLEYGAGIGCACKVGGNILFGSRGMAGEIGHTHVSGVSVPCPCGSIGCLEAVAALPAIGQQAGCDGREVLSRAFAGDKMAMRIVDEAFERVGTALGSLVNVLNPKAVVLDSIMAEAGKPALERLRWAMLQQIMPSHAEDLEVIVSEMAEPVAPIGGALIALGELTEKMSAESQSR